MATHSEVAFGVADESRIRWIPGFSSMIFARRTVGAVEYIKNQGLSAGLKNRPTRIRELTMPWMRQGILGSWAFLAMFAMAQPAGAVPGCPFCAPSDPPFSSRLAGCDVAVEVKWV